MCSEHNPERADSVVGYNLKRARVAAGLTPCDVATRLDVSPEAVVAMEAGRFRPDIRFLQKIAGLYACRLADFFAPIDCRCCHP